MNVKTTRLNNGIKVVIHPSKGLETVGMAIGVRYGSVDENPIINGSAHFLEHMLFKGTTKRTWKEINEKVRDIGAMSNAVTSPEDTEYYLSVYKKYVDKGFELLSDMIKNSTIPADEMELEREIIINENLMHMDNPRFLFYDYIPRMLYKKNPIKMPVGGDNEKTIKNITRAHLFDIYKKQYVPENIVIAFSGAITYEQSMAVVKKYFGNFSGGMSKLNRHPAREKQKQTTLTINKVGIKQAKIGIGFKCREFPKNDISEYLAMYLMDKYLGYKLFEEIREKRGLSYDPTTTYVAENTYGFISAEAGTEPKNIEKVKKIILNEFKKLEDGEITKTELDRIKKSVRIQLITSREHSLNFALNLIEYNFIGNDSSLAERLPDLIKTVTIDDVRKFASTYIKTDKYGMVILKPKSEK